MEVLEVANKRGIDWQFIRIGEEFGDIDNLNSDNLYKNNPSAVMYPHTEIAY